MDIDKELEGVLSYVERRADNFRRAASEFGLGMYDSVTSAGHEFRLEINDMRDVQPGQAFSYFPPKFSVPEELQSRGRELDGVEQDFDGRRGEYVELFTECEEFERDLLIELQRYKEKRLEEQEPA